jgi:hypothetical protein
VSHRIVRCLDPDDAVDAYAYDPDEKHQARLKRIARLIASDLPTDPQSAIEPSRFAARWRLAAHWIEVQQIPGVLLTPEGRIYRRSREIKTIRK